MSNRDRFGFPLKKAIKENMLREFDLVELEEKIYKHKNMVFKISYSFHPEIFIYDTDDTEVIKDSLKNKNYNLTILHVYGEEDVSEKFAELPDFEPTWFIRGKWVDYLREYFQNMDNKIKEMEKNRAALEELEKQKQEKKEKLELQNKIKSVEQFF